MKRQLFLALSMAALASVQTAGANEIFNKHCAACHAGGKNIMNPDKTLSKEHLEKNGMNSVDAIKNLVSKGKAPMPAFESMLDAKQIEEVAAYVLEQAEKGWQ